MHACPRCGFDGHEDEDDEWEPVADEDDEEEEDAP